MKGRRTALAHSPHLPPQGLGIVPIHFKTLARGRRSWENEGARSIPLSVGQRECRKHGMDFSLGTVGDDGEFVWYSSLSEALDM